MKTSRNQDGTNQYLFNQKMYGQKSSRLEIYSFTVEHAINISLSPSNLLWDIQVVTLLR